MASFTPQKVKKTIIRYGWIYDKMKKKTKNE